MEEKKHSGLGIASFVTSITSGTLTLLLFLVAGVAEISTPGGMSDKFSMMVGFCTLSVMAATIVAFGLSIGGLFQKEKRKIFAILGTVFSVVFFVLPVVVIVLGTLIEKN